MNNNYIIPLLIAIIVLRLLVDLAKKKKSSTRETTCFEKKPTLLTITENKFYQELLNITPPAYHVFAQVRMEDVLKVKKGYTKKDYFRYRNAIKSRHFDFVICEQKTSKILLAIELDDKSHNKKSSKDRDKFVNAICENTGLKLLRYKVQSQYDLEKLKLDLSPEVKFPISKPIVEEQPFAEVKSKISKLIKTEILNVVQKSDNSQKLCSKCESEMVIRTAKKGKNIGKQFWACSAFPKCRNLEEIK
jgi:hypothetical protein